MGLVQYKGCPGERLNARTDPAARFPVVSHVSAGRSRRRRRAYRQSRTAL